MIGEFLSEMLWRYKNYYYNFFYFSHNRTFWLALQQQIIGLISGLINKRYSLWSWHTDRSLGSDQWFWFWHQACCSTMTHVFCHTKACPIKNERQWVVAVRRKRLISGLVLYLNAMGLFCIHYLLHCLCLLYRVVKGIRYELCVN